MTARRTILSCHYCTKEFKYESEKRRHEQSHFSLFQCKVCSKNFGFISALRRHEKQHERTGSVQCSKCDREFRDNILLKRHIKYAHGGTYTCTECSATFSSVMALSTHMITHKAESERRYRCSFVGCSKKFNFTHHLKRHELTHINTKQHYCKICNKGFIQLYNLKIHMKTHDADFPLHCTFPECTKKFTTEYAKKRHMAKHHIKTDSGISSDSNSACDLSYILKKKPDCDTITCSSCEKVIPMSHYEKHILNCIKNADLPVLNYDNSEIGDDMPTTLVKNEDDEVCNCKLRLGSCITSEKGEKCVCAQISKTTDNVSYFTPIDNESINMRVVNINISNSCEGCECSERCDIKNRNPRAVIPEIEYKTDGTVKIKDTFDLDIPLAETVEVTKSKNEVKFFPYNSCKAVLGNCIVSGNGTMGDGCLCAKMILDDQVTAQEIDDITPHPKLELFCD